MRGAAALVRLSTYEVETLQKRVAEVAARKVGWQLRLASLDAEAEAEATHARTYAEAGLYLIGFREGWRQRRAVAEAELAALEQEEAAAREALNRAFESLKKVEHVVELARLSERREAARRDAAALDELALRGAALRGAA